MNGPRDRSLKIAAVEGALGVACNLPPADRADRAASLRDLLRQAVDCEESATGIMAQFRATNETVRSALELVLAERQSCPAFRYGLWFEPGTDSFVLSVDAGGTLVAPLQAVYRGLAATRWDPVPRVEARYR